MLTSNPLISLPQTDSLAWTDAQGGISFNALSKKIEQFSQSGCINPNATLLLPASPSIEFIITLIACLNHGAPVAVVQEGVSEKEREEFAQILGRSYCFGRNGETIFLCDKNTQLHSKTALVLFTSGSSGQAKGVQLSRENIRAGIDAVSRSLHFSDVNEQQLILNLHYSFGLLGQLLPALELGIHTRFHSHILMLASGVRNGELGGMLSGVPSQLSTLLDIVGDEPFEAVEKVVLAGAHTPASLRKKLVETFPKATVYVNYGQTEASPRILCLPSSDTAFLSEATGYPVEGIELKLSEGEELLVKGPQIMLGYVGAKLNPVQDGWLHTGDLAHIDEEGIVTLKGRKDLVVKVNGEKVPFSEVEQAMEKGPAVKAALVFVEENSVGIEQLSALVELENSHASLSEIFEPLASVLDAHKMPQTYYACATLPKTANGKVDRTAIPDVVKLAEPLK